MPIRFMRAFTRAFITVTLLAVMLVAREAVQSPQPAYADVAYSTDSPYWITNPAGHVFSFNDAQDFGSLKGQALNKPIVAMAPTATEDGYWLVGSDGGIFAFGDAQFLGSTGAIRLNQPIVGLTPTPTNNGYWMVARDGGIFAFGDAQFYGSTGNIALNKPIIGMAPTPTNKGYWLFASDGGIFAFGDAQFFGSTGNIVLTRPIVSMAATPSKGGYWLAASDGGIFAFGDAKFYGSAGDTGSVNFAKIIAATDSKGYWLVRNGGDSLAYGSANATTASAGWRTTPKRPAVALMYSVADPGEAAVNWALGEMDKGYIWGGNGPAGYDCSGLTSQAWKRVGVSIPRVANDQYDFGRHVTMDELKAGDLLFYGNDLGNSRSIDHVAMYIGGGWAINSGGNSKPSRVSLRDVSYLSGRSFPLAVRPLG